MVTECFVIGRKPTPLHVKAQGGADRKRRGSRGVLRLPRYWFQSSRGWFHANFEQGRAVAAGPPRSEIGFPAGHASQEQPLSIERQAAAGLKWSTAAKIAGQASSWAV